MATNPMTMAVLLWQHHQTTTPYMPQPNIAQQAAGTRGRSAPADRPPAPEKVDEPPFDTEKDDEEEEEQKGEETDG